MLETLVWTVVVVHFAYTLLVAVGGFLVWRWRGLFWTHMVMLAHAMSVPLLQPPCPLTALEKWLRHEAGLPVYSTHFIEQYVYQVLHPYPWWLFDAFMIAMPIFSYTLLARYGRARLVATAT